MKKSDTKCRTDENNSLAPIMSIDKTKEYIIVDEEIKKCQKMFEIENRKMNKMISGIKRSGKDVKNKTKKIRKHNELQVIEAKLNGNLKVEQQMLTKETNDSKNFSSHNEIQSYYKQELNNLTEIKNYLDSLNDFKDEIQIDDRRAKSPCQIDAIFKDMEKLNKSFENLRINKPTDQQNDQYYHSDNNLDCTEKIQNYNINDSKRLKEMKGNGRERETYNASEFTESDGKRDKTVNNSDDDELRNSKRVADFREEYLAKKFWKKWIQRIKSKKNEEISAELMSRKVVDSKFDSFLFKLQKSLKKRKTENNSETEKNHDVKREKLVKYGEKFKNRFEAQKDIIEKQKRILEEQKKKIRELEKDGIKSEQGNLGIRNEIEKSKNKDRVTEKKGKKYKSYVYEEPVFLINMAKRAQERKEKREKLNEIKRMKEEQKIKMKLKEDEEKKRKEDEKKYDQIKAEQMEYLRKFIEEEDRKRNRMNMMEAERRIVVLHREIILNRCFTLWKKLMEERKNKIKRLHQIVDSILKKKSFRILKINYEMCKKEKLILAESFRKYKLQKKYGTVWYQVSLILNHYFLVVKIN